VVTAGSPNTRYGYTGRELDAATGLMYYRARWYDPQQARFITEDPIGFAGGDTNLYAYVGNDPINFTDPLGLEGKSVLLDTPEELAERLEGYLDEREKFNEYLEGPSTRMVDPGG
jgi:RHS repeat-associated protein